MNFFSSLKNRLQLMVLAALLPVLPLLLYADLRHRRSIEIEVRSNVRTLSLMARGNLNTHIDETRNLLFTLSHTSEMLREDHKVGTGFLRKIHSNFPNYANMGMADAQGDLVSSSVPIINPVNSSDLFWFRQAVRTRDFSIGEYQVGRIVGFPVLVMSQPMFGQDGRIKSVLYTSINLGLLKKLVTEVTLPAGYAFVITDRNGTILARHPDPERWTGKPLPEPLRRALLRPDQDLAEVPGIDGETRIYAVSTAGYKDNPLHIAIGISRCAAFAELNKILAIDLVLLLLVGAGGMLAARLISGALILRPVHALKSAAHRLAEGDLGARTGLPPGTDEIRLLAETFDRMAETIQTNATARKEMEKRLVRTARILSAIGKCNELVAHAREERELMDDVCRSIVSAEGYRFAWVGYVERDERKSIRPVAQSGFEEGYLETADVTWADTERGRGPTGTAVRTGTPSACRHIPTDPKFEPWRAEAIKRGYASSIALPLVLGEHSLGVINVYAEEPDAFDEEESGMLAGMAETLAHGIRSLRTEAERDKASEELNRHHEYLEVLVSERTAELEKKIAEIERLNKLFIGRELKMAELKERIKELEGNRER